MAIQEVLYRMIPGKPEPEVTEQSLRQEDMNYFPEGSVQIQVGNRSLVLDEPMLRVTRPDQVVFHGVRAEGKFKGKVVEKAFKGEKINKANIRIQAPHRGGVVTLVWVDPLVQQRAA